MQISADFANSSRAIEMIPLPGARRAGGGGVAGWIIPGTLFIGALVFFLFFLVNGAVGDLQSAVALAITAVPFLIVAVEAPGRLLHPLSIFGFTMLLGIAGQTIYLTHGHPAALPELLSGLSPDILNRGLLVVSVGVVALGVGYLASSNRGHGSLRPGRLLTWGVQLGLAKPSPRRAFWVALVMCVISLVAFGLYAPKVGLHSPGDLLSSRKRFVVENGHVLVYGYYRFVISLASPTFILLAYIMVRNGISLFSRLGAVALVSLLLVAGYATVTSSRTELLATLAVAVFVAIALRRREPRSATIVAVTVVAIACLTLLGGLRAVDTGQARSLSSTTGTDALLENAVGNESWMDIGPISVLVQRVPQAYPYQYGKTLVSILWEPIPRTLWPGKPPVRIGPVIGPPVFGYSERRISGHPPGIVGELWLNGGVFVVVAGMVLVGAIIRWVERLYRLAPQTDGLSAIPYGILIVGTCLQLPIDDVTGVLTPILEYLVTLAVLLWLVRERSPRRSLDTSR
jgi:oligosaccharide repeat unit polymerase